ncbi:universal stress protein [Prosthecobacter sp. SYSU 5D2]|uniref:universal stress protein n=1 Tax=Prosthecobacter sp. SYSU 5D2 TaxID=3134134 RepID=UPI0031FF3BA5
MTTPTIPGFWQKILVPTDFSNCSLAALKSASRLQETSTAQIVLLHVTEEGHEGLRIRTEDLHDKMRYEAEQTLRKLAKEHFPRPDEIVVQIEEGRPAETICQVAEKEKADVILIPTHGHTGLKHMLLGSIAEKVVRQAHCDVLVVRQ